MPIDKEKYRATLQPLGLTRAQEDKIITALYAIMSEFVTAAFGKSEAQLVRAERQHIVRRQCKTGQSKSFVPRSRRLRTPPPVPLPPQEGVQDSIREG